jgi:GT2 family glycosyltransferase
VGAAVRLPDGRLSEMNRPGRNPFASLGTLLGALRRGREGFHAQEADLAPDAAPYPADTISFVGYFVSRGAVAVGGLPEAGLFIYGDDLLYSLRLRKRGIPLLLDPAIRFTHDCGSFGAGMHYRPLWKIYYHARNGVSIAWMAGGPLIFPAALCYYLVVWWGRSRHCPPEQRPTYRRLMWRGLRDGLLCRRGRNPEAHRIAALAEARKAL